LESAAEQNIKPDGSPDFSENLWNDDFSHRPSWCDARLALLQIENVCFILFLSVTFLIGTICIIGHSKRKQTRFIFAVFPSVIPIQTWMLHTTQKLASNIYWFGDIRLLCGRIAKCKN